MARKRIGRYKRLQDGTVIDRTEYCDQHPKVLGKNIETIKYRDPIPQTNGLANRTCPRCFRVITVK